MYTKNYCIIYFCLPQFINPSILKVKKMNNMTCSSWENFSQIKIFVDVLQPYCAMYHDFLVAFGSRQVSELHVYIYLDHVYIGRRLMNDLSWRRGFQRRIAGSLSARRTSFANYIGRYDYNLFKNPDDA